MISDLEIQSLEFALCLALGITVKSLNESQERFSPCIFHISETVIDDMDIVNWTKCTFLYCYA